MKKLKKLLTLICVGTLVAVMGLLTACGGTPNTPEPDDKDKPTPPPATTVTVKLDKTTLSLEEGATGELNVTVTGSEETPKVESSNKAAATAALDGKKITVTAVAAGTTDITVSVGDKSDKCVVTVTAPEKPAESLALESTYVLLEDSYTENDDTDDLTEVDLKVTYNGTAAVTAVTDKTAVATAAYADGKVTLSAVGTGKTTLTVTAGELTKTCTVEVATFGLVYGVQIVYDEEGNESSYMEVSGSARLTSPDVYIPGYAYDVDSEEYLPVTRIKGAETKDAVIVPGSMGAFQPAQPADGEEAHDPIVTVYTGDNVGTVGAGAFRGNKKLTTVSFGPALRKLDIYAFDQCASLTTINWGESQVTEIHRCAFSACTALTEVTIPATVTFLGDGTFSGDNLLTKVKILGPIKVLEGQILLTHEPIALTLWLPGTIERVAKDAVGNHSGNHTSVEIFFDGTREQYAAIEYFTSSFDGLVSNMLRESGHVTIHCTDDDAPRMSLDKTESDTNVHAGPITITATTENLDGVEVTATSSNTAVATVAVNDKVITVTPVAVGTATITVTCGELTATCEVTFGELKLADTPNIMVGVGQTAVLQVNGNSATVANDSVATAAYADGLVTITGVANGSTKLTVGEDECTIWVGTTGLTYAASEDEKYLIVSAGSNKVQDLYIPGYATLDNVTYLPVKKIANNGFQAYTGLVSVFTGDNVETIGERAFYNIDETFTTIKMGRALKVLETSCFDDCEKSTMTLDWGESQPTTIGFRAFGWCGFEYLTIPKTVTSLGKNLCQGCDKIKEIKILCDNLQLIDEFTFMTPVTNITLYISKGVKAIHPKGIRQSDAAYTNVTIYYEGTAAEYATLIETAKGEDGHCYNSLKPTADGGNATVTYDVDFSNL